jgi:hypothetical protein
MEPKIVLIDGDSIAYKAGYANSIAECEQSVRNKMWQILNDCGVMKYELYLECWKRKKIFRHKFIETKSYKGNRKGNPPKYLNHAREIIAGIDKDLLQYPLTFYNYNQRTMSRLTTYQAQLNLWKQVLTGDSVDNIPGLRGYGPIKAAKTLKGAEIDDMPYVVAKTYAKTGFGYNYYIEQYNLIKLRNTRGTKLLRPITQEEFEEYIDET